MLQLIKMTREGVVGIWEEHFKTILLLLLETLGDSDVSLFIFETLRDSVLRLLLLFKTLGDSDVSLYLLETLKVFNFNFYYYSLKHSKTQVYVPPLILKAQL